MKSNCLKHPDQSVREEMETVQGETEVMVGRLQAALESHSEPIWANHPDRTGVFQTDTLSSPLDQVSGSISDRANPSSSFRSAP